MYLYIMFHPCSKLYSLMRKIVLCALFLLVALGMRAQEVSEQDANQKSKAINQVKLSEQAMYAEVVELASDDFEAVSLAQQKTINKLQNNVIEACAQRMNITKEQAKEIFDIIDDKCQNVVVRKGDMVRVFAYIAKDAVGLTRKKAKQKDLDEIFGPEEDADSTLIADNTAQAMNLLMGKNDSIDNVSYQQLPTTTTTTTTTTTVVTTTAVTQPVVSATQQVVASVQPVMTPVQQPVAASTQPVVVPAPAPKVEPAPAPVVEVSVPALCQTMIDKGNMKELMRYLSQEKRYHRLMFGNFSSMQYPEKCYIVILDKGTQNIVSVLDKGDTERMNFVSKKMDRYINYRNGNYAAVFVQEY